MTYGGFFIIKFILKFAEMVSESIASCHAVIEDLYSD